MGVVRTRLTYGSVIVAAVSGLFWLDKSVLPYLVVGLIAASLALVAQAEFYLMLRSAGMRPALRLGLFTGGYYLATRLVPAVEWYFKADRQGPVPVSRGFDAGAHLAAATILLLVLGVLRRKPEQAPQKIGATLVGLLLIPFLLGYIIEIRYMPDGWAWVIFLVAVAKTGDSFAFFVGKFLGRHKLIPEISPNKTWEGAIASLAGGLLTAWVVAITAFPTPLPPEKWIIAGVVVNLGAQFGDLGESLLKRGCGTKDSAALFPVFGGVFDLVDSFLIAAPALRLTLAILG